MTDKTNTTDHNNYQTRAWDVEELPLGSADEPHVEVAAGFEVCGFDTSVGREYLDGRRQGRPFFIDLEQAEAGLGEEGVGGYLGILTEEWRGHSVGTLVLQSYTGMGKSPMTTTWMVEKPAEPQPGPAPVAQ